MFIYTIYRAIYMCICVFVLVSECACADCALCSQHTVFLFSAWL